MPVEENPDFTFSLGVITVPYLGKTSQYLSFFVNSRYNFPRRARIVSGDVTVYIAKPTVRFLSPSYFCHDRMRRSISSFDITRPL